MSKLYTINDVIYLSQKALRDNSLRFKFISSCVLSGSTEDSQIPFRHNDQLVDTNRKIITVESIYEKFGQLFYRLRENPNQVEPTEFDNIIEHNKEHTEQNIRKALNQLENRIKDQNGNVDLQMLALKFSKLLFTELTDPSEMDNGLLQLGQGVEQKVNGAYKVKANGLIVDPRSRSYDNYQRCTLCEYDRISEVLENILIRYSK